MNTENLSTLKIHKLTQTQYDREFAAGTLEPNAIYLTPDEEYDLSKYVTIEQLDDKADAVHIHDISDITNLQSSLEGIEGRIAEAKNSIDGITAGTVAIAKAQNAETAVSAETADLSMSSVKATQDGDGNVITSTYETKTDATEKLNEAKDYVDQKIATIPTPDVSGQINSHNNDTTAHSDIRAVIDNVASSIPNALSDLSADSTHRTVTDEEKETWNKKSNFSGSYNDLTDKPTIPSIDGLATTAYADSVANNVKNDLLNGAGAAYDTLKELGDLIDVNVDAIDALETVAASKANTSDLTAHTGNKSNPHGVTAAQISAVPTSRTVNGKALSENISLTASDVGAAASSHNHDDKYYTEYEIDSKFGAGNVLATAVVS